MITCEDEHESDIAVTISEQVFSRRIPQRFASKEIPRPKTRGISGEHPPSPFTGRTLDRYLPAARGAGEFFDSYGTAPDDPRLPKTIAKFLEHQAEETVFQQNQLQHPRAVTCGHHCVFFLESRAGGLSFDQILKLYSDDVLKNDRMVIRFVRNRKARLCRKPYGLFQHVQTCCPLCKNQL